MTFFAIVALKTVINIGIWQTVVAIIAFFTTILLANLRYEGNRLRIMLYAIFGLLFALLLLMFSGVSIYFYVAFSLLLVIIKPIYRVSEHATDLRSMDFLARGRTSFYPGILYRDTVLYFGRLVFLGLLAAVSVSVKNDLLSARIAIVVYGVIILLNWFVAKNMIKENNHN